MIFELKIDILLADASRANVVKVRAQSPVIVLPMFDPAEDGRNVLLDFFDNATGGQSVGRHWIW